VKTPALTAWRRELATGERTKYTFDALWRAACAEAEALEFLGQRLPSIAAACRLRAQRIIRDAMKEQRGRGRAA
jgi:hypothetical protein